MSRKIIDITKNSLGTRLMTVRKGKNLTQQAFASALGTSAGYISEAEAGKSVPGGSLLTSLCRIFNVNINWLLTGEGPMYIDDVGQPSPVIDLAARSPAWKMCKQVERIVTEGDRKKIEGLKGMLKALDPGEVPLEGLGDGEDEGAGAKADSA